MGHLIIKQILQQFMSFEFGVINSALCKLAHFIQHDNNVTKYADLRVKIMCVIKLNI
jgi:hypothetical protein